MLRGRSSSAAPSEQLDLDFEGETIDSVSFLDEGIAVIFLDHAPEYIRARLTTSTMVPGGRDLLNEQVAKQAREAKERTLAVG